MRENVEIVWLEDTPSDRGHRNREKIVKDLIEAKGYLANIKPFVTLSEAKEVLQNPEKRVDFFISDFNLGSDETGLDYLLEIRQKEMYKQFFILYSKNEYDEIKSNVIEKLQGNRIDLFCNFTFISLADGTTELIKQDFCKAIDISLSRWDELNAIRGIYMSANAEFESELKNKFSHEYTKKQMDIDKATYKDLFGKLKRTLRPPYKDMHKKTFNDWEDIINNRNLLAHGTEEYDKNSKSFSLKSSDGSIVISEMNLDSIRLELKSLRKKVLFLIENPHRSYPKR
ncbi:hypothetical protein FACS1894193_06240 [Bacilli bacterium]|nr:hypothetical protein FACS1894193_06240 [Bacilli bacterium]GHU45603.1 hypothetical protein FACS1894194_1710 [Bacilli bacterium]